MLFREQVTQAKPDRLPPKSPLITFEEGLQALRKAKESEYEPPRSEIPYFGVYRKEA